MRAHTCTHKTTSAHACAHSSWVRYPGIGVLTAVAAILNPLPSTLDPLPCALCALCPNPLTPYLILSTSRGLRSTQSECNKQYISECNSDSATGAKLEELSPNTCETGWQWRLEP